MENGELHRYCLVQYKFKDGKERPILPRPHKNTRNSSQAYVRTWESTKSLIRDAAKDMRPREIVYKTVAESLGGMSKCSSHGQLPRGRQQVKDLARNNGKNVNERKRISGKGGDDDPWYRLLGECKKQVTESRNTAFIRDVRVAPEPLCVMSTDRQINDLKRFCCNAIEYRPFTVDPTFDIGRYNVTPITYQHLLLENKRDGKCPSFIGPIMIHEKKTKETYSAFSGTLRNLQPALRDVFAFGTDDEEALIDGFRNNFDRSVNLLCEIHLKKNVEKKLQELGIKGKTKDEVVADIFGRKIGSIHESGLIDAKDAESFDAMLVSLDERWSAQHANGKEFHKWFSQRKRPLFVNSAIAPVRQRAGLGHPPEKFTTNRSEQTNRAIQEFARQESKDKRNVDEFSFCISMSKLVNIQKLEIELAIVGNGEYRLREKFRHLEIPPEQWTKMNAAQKEKAVVKIHSITLEESVAKNINTIDCILDDDNNSLLNEMIQAGIDWIPRSILSSILRKAETLNHNAGAIIQQTENTFVVASKTNPRKPHVVNFYGNGKVDCTDCPSWASLSICAHAVASCVKSNRTKQFIRWFVCSQRNKGGVNLSKAVTYGMPKGRGKKGQREPRKKSKGSQQPPTSEISRVPMASFPSQDSVRPFHVETYVPNTNQPQHWRDAATGSISSRGGELFGMSSNQGLQNLHRPNLNNPSFCVTQPTHFIPPQPTHFAPPQPVMSCSQPIQNQFSHGQPQPVENQVPSAHLLWQQAAISRNPPTAYLQRPPGFPNPNYGEFLVYMLQFCPSKTSSCFGCGLPLKDGSAIRKAPDDLVIVSKMYREFSYQGNPQSKLANVYFHCKWPCLQRKQPNFEGRMCCVSENIKSRMATVHKEYLRINFGL